ncbi:MAG TPA: thioredoxin domain-containing protein [Acidimicrobiales bacterium]|nr:thioredoxin domain-containing protein [Acidimicrobiales bacterium]
MERFLLAAVVVVLAAAVAVWFERRRPEAPTQGAWPVPTQLDRADFGGVGTPWLVAVFTSATCNSCAEAMDKARVLASDEVWVEEVEVKAQADLHRRYNVEAVPTLVVADAEGVVRASFVGPPSATDLWAAVAEARAPGSSPEPELGRG